MLLNRFKSTAFRAAAVGVLTASVVLLVSAAPAHAQQTNTVSSLYLSSGSELDFRLFGTTGATGTNGTNSDRITSSSVFNYSSASSGNYIVGFSHGDNSPLLPGSVYTLVTFGSTNFAATDATHFTAAPRGNVGAISGNFILNPGTGSGGTLQFQLTGEADLPEPNAVWLLVSGALTGVSGMIARTRCETA